MKLRNAGALAVLAFVLTVAIMATVPALAKSKTYYFGVSDQRTNITFESTTDFEVILGSTNRSSGWIRADLGAGSGSVDVSVPVESLRTGIDLRDEHLRSPMWLDSETYPEIRFAADRVGRRSDGKWEARGKFTMHGVTRDLTVPVDVREISADLAARAGLEKGEWLRVSTSFPVKLSEYGVKIPDMAAAKVEDEWNVRILAFTSTVSARAAANPCNPCGGKPSAKKAVNPCNPCGGNGSGKKAMNPCNPCGN